MKHLRTGVAALMVLSFSVCSGCALLCPRAPAQALSECGEIRLDYPACRKLRTVAHKTWRDGAGLLVVRTEWRNTSASPFQAQVRALFFDHEGNREQNEERWDPHTFPPGSGHIIECSSETPDAVRYLIEVKSSSRWPF